MIQVSTLYDEYIDRPKLSEKNPFEYIVPTPSRGVGTKMLFSEYMLDGTLSTLNRQLTKRIALTAKKQQIQRQK